MASEALTKKLPTTAELISKQLLTEVNSLLKKFRMRRFDNVEDLAEADEWQGLNRLFRSAGERYAKASLRAEDDRRVWSRKNIESDGQAIHQQHAQNFCLLQSRRSDLGIDNVLRVFETKVDFAMSEATCAAAVCIDGSELRSPTLKGQTPIEMAARQKLRDVPQDAHSANLSIENSSENDFSTSRKQTDPSGENSDALGKRKIRRSKKIDLSRYLDTASLTEKQYRSASLKWEYGLSVSEIARELNRTRKTVDQHISAAQSKMRVSGQYEKLKKKLSQTRPGE